jgi:hydroxymethylpyrimidine/phosphomethylpyrimidine kinase
MKKVLLTVAGFDPCSGAGATLDLRVFHHFGFYGLAVLTSITVQNSFKIYGFKSISPELILDQYCRLRADFKPSGIKIGMLGKSRAIPAIEEIVSENKKLPIVIDPVFKSSSGKWLLEKKYIQKYIQAISGKITLITPNLNEASLIAGSKIETVDGMKKASERISHLTESACLIKGGHLKDKAVDVLYDRKRFHFFEKKKLQIKVHGTGCFLSSAILCFLAQGLSLTEACHKASLSIEKFLNSPLHLARNPLLDI